MNRSDLGKRLKARHSPYIYVSLYYAEGGEFFGLLADLSASGFKLVSDLEFPTNMQYDLAINNPLASNAEPNTFSAKAIWSNQCPDGLFEAGFQFIHLEGESAALFKRLEQDFEATAKLINAIDHI